MQSIGLEFLKNSHAEKGGAISLYGTLRFHPNSCRGGGACFGGIGVWSREFLNHGRKGNRVRIEPDGIVTIIDGAGDVVSIVEREDIAAVDSETVKIVVRSQYLRPFEYNDSDYEEALLCADRGERPALFDNSPFIKVLDSPPGTELVLLELDNGSDGTFKVFTKDGEEVPHQVLYPLSYERWGEPLSSGKAGASMPPGEIAYFGAHENYLLSFGVEYEQDSIRADAEYSDEVNLRALASLRLAGLSSDSCKNGHPENSLIVIQGGDDVGKIKCTACEITILPTELFKTLEDV
ncbi:MAG: hypothetical protein A3H69_01410 [Candidatus Sungbacteria bacterium RIFCSPLOWO2_02_FULL_47_9]|uniref:Uncharacterized protein n=1 Tax=Candidatus Sungbacteria bacterium RIFCSPHIGHO2_01_FULL_47_32 TaxID=1802264 RepID=A0A1G2K7T7_9BACT|nr:MAG: hypothetical protein A2633_01275 [Candidatus Sungbacteria bacterium RIFCSPHIGHO2_01_FULL_47_32]OHA04839.1 MAG: hypothetical protein A3A28_05030 [Candidatus Sungbacteria bacterium RIFCSPLOWO2_01_FULL_47_32]OHA11770.1 MAG: hypothetical protein A3H69_01410 [Candidatus Sungbacteria bacterium RIFCSPLOWO2_02_FULL_47_9]